MNAAATRRLERIARGMKAARSVGATAGRESSRGHPGDDDEPATLETILQQIQEMYRGHPR